MGGVTSDADSSAGVAGVENVCEGGQRGTDGLTGCIHNALQNLVLSSSRSRGKFEPSCYLLYFQEGDNLLFLGV